MMLRENFRQTDKSAQSVYDEILAALQEMMPEQGAKLRDLARSLSEEYMRERSQAFQDMHPKHPEAPMTEQMIVEQAYYDQKDQERREERMKRRLEDLQRRDAKGEMQASRPLRPPGSAQGITPSVQYDAPRGGGPPRHPDFVKDTDPNKGWGQAIVQWHNPQTGERIAMPDGSYSPRTGSPWRKGTGESSTPWLEPEGRPITYQKFRAHPAYQQPRPAAMASNQPAISRMQGGNTAAHAMMLDRMQDPYADPAHLQRMRQSQAAAARSGGYPMPTQPSFGPIERTYRA